MTNHPTAICGNIEIGLPTCSKGRRGMCYWMGVCSSQMRIDNPKVRTAKAEKLYKEEKERAIEISKTKYSTAPELTDKEVDRMVESIMSSYKKEKRK